MPFDPDFISSIKTEMPLVSDRFILEPILESHAGKLFTSLQAPQLYIYIPHEPPQDLSKLQYRYSRLSQRHSDSYDEVWLNWAVKKRDQDIYVGTLQSTLTFEGKTYIAYETFPNFWRQRIAQETCRVILNYLFQICQREVITSLMDTRNEPSWRLMESLGFERKGIIKDADFFKGTSSDEYLYELDRSRFFKV